MVFWGGGAYGSLPDAAIWWCLRTGGGGILTSEGRMQSAISFKALSHAVSLTVSMMRGVSGQNSSGVSLKIWMVKQEPTSSASIFAMSGVLASSSKFPKMPISFPS